ncbi:hypothetical protein IMF27_14900 [Pseudomonas sp. PCH199]|uniref:hypothetical protein n=1 Tax=unclassified Pseudomonas TaxID=196821 RepID=UPI000FFBB2A5|nr:MULTISPECIES: hypothetical protein [unclassified Pseudomonas]MCW8276804.1 hypothetical protein [Pseudomonas sp. PCH199]
MTNPVLGNGLGVKHEMQWEASDGVFLTKYVGYVHNWLFYILMVGGISGLIIYSLVLFGPVVFRLSSISSESTYWTLIRAVLMTMIVYAAFFAVFRLITFNLLIAATWGVVYAKIIADRQNNQRDSESTVNPLKELNGQPDLSY